MSTSGPRQTACSPDPAAGHDIQQPARIRGWIVLGLAGLLVVLALPSLWDAWQIDRAGIFLNRAIVTAADAAIRSEAASKGDSPEGATAAGAAPWAPGQSPVATAEEQAGSNSSGNSTAARLAIIAGGDYLITPAVEAGLRQALALMESVGARGPHTAAREVPIWRTYGAAARMLPSDHSFELLLRSRNAGRLDWLGELWLGEVASDTGHWTEAGEAYRRVDVSNLLIYRAEAHIEDGEKDLALRELTLAKASLDAAVDREKARLLLLDRTGRRPSPLQDMLQRPAERATSLSRIGHSLVLLGHPSEAVPVLEQGLAIAEVSSPGVTVGRNLRLDLAAALAETLSAPSANSGASSSGYSYFPNSGEMARLAAVIRLESLVSQALALERTAAVCAWAGSILVTAGEDDKGVALLSEAIRLDPKLGDAYLGLGAWDERKGLVLLAERLYAQAAEQVPDSPAIAAALALTTFETGPHQEALPLLERAAVLGTNDPLVFASLGDCYLEAGRNAEARAAWEEGLRRAPDSEVLADRLGTIQAYGATGTSQ